MHFHKQQIFGEKESVSVNQITQLMLTSTKINKNSKKITECTLEESMF